MYIHISAKGIGHMGHIVHFVQGSSVFPIRINRHSCVQEINRSCTKLMCKFNGGTKWVQLFNKFVLMNFTICPNHKILSINLFQVRDLRSYPEKALVSNLSINRLGKLGARDVPKAVPPSLEKVFPVEPKVNIMKYNCFVPYHGTNFNLA